MSTAHCHFAIHPDPGQSPVAFDGVPRNLKNLGGLIQIEPAKEAQLHDPGLPGIEFRKSLQRIIDLHQVGICIRRNKQRLVDTGADCTVIDTRAARRLQLHYLAQTVKYSAVGKTAKARLALVEDLQAGPIATSLACIVGKIPTEGVDIILGLNVLSKHNFEINYERHKIVFDPSDRPSSHVSLEPGGTLIVVKAQVRGKLIRALVDTGAAAHCVFEESQIIRPLDYGGLVAVTPHMGGSSHSSEVALSSLMIGSTEWKDLDAMAMSNGKPLSWDAVLSVGKLGVKRIYFDFKHRSLSWTR
jgi:predicted aspartyl protease